jgi:hypothetical protein
LNENSNKKILSILLITLIGSLSVDIFIVYSSPGQIFVYGYFYCYEPYRGTYLPIRRAEVKLYDSDLYGAVLNELATSYTDDQGRFFFGPINNDDGPFEGGLDVFVRVYLKTDTVIVGVGITGDLFGLCYYAETPKRDNVPDGNVDYGTQSISTSPNPNWPYAFRIYNRIIEASDWLYSKVGWRRTQVAVYYPNDLNGNLDVSGYCDSLGFLWENGIIPGLALPNHIYIPNDYWAGGTYSDEAIIHEYGHAIMDSLYSGIPRGSYSGTHYWGQATDTTFAFVEGWANFFACAVRGSSYCLGYDAERNDWPQGDNVEGAVTGIFWDIFDGSSDGRDSLSLGVDETFNILRYRKPSTIHEFWTYFTGDYGLIQQLWGIYYDHGINKDSVPPSNPTSFSSSPPVNQWSNDNTVDISWSGASDGISGINGYYCRWTSGGPGDPIGYYYTTNSYATSSPLSDGTWYFNVRSRDNAGNDAIGYVYYGPFKIDKTPPGTPSVSGPTGWTKDNTPHITWTTVSDSLSGTAGYEYAIDQSSSWNWLGNVLEFDTPVLSDGPHRVYIRAKDNAGNRGNPGYCDIYVDANPPSGTVIINGGATYTRSTSVTLSFTASDDSGSGISQVGVSNDGSTYSWYPYQPSLSWNLNPPDGRKMVYVKFKDNVAWESSPVLDDIILDTTPPTAPVLSSPSNGATVGSRPSFSWSASSDSASGVDSYTLEIDTSTSFSTANLKRYSGIVTTSFTLPVDLSSGTWYWRVRAKDKAGNNGSWSSTWSFHVQIQTSANLWLVVRGIGDGIYYRAYVGTWGNWVRLPGLTCDAPAATVWSNELHMVVRGKDGLTLWHGYVNLNTGAFSGWARISGSTPSPPALADAGNKLYLVVRGISNEIYLRIYDCTSRSWGNWIRLPGNTYNGPSATIVGNTLHIVVQGGSQSIWHGRMDITTNQWLGWTKLTGLTPSSPALAASADGNIYLVVHGTDNRIYWNRYDGASWTGWQVIPSGLTDIGPGIGFTNNKIYVCVKSISNTFIYVNEMDLTIDRWLGWSRLDGATPSGPELCGP